MARRILDGMCDEVGPITEPMFSEDYDLAKMPQRFRFVDLEGYVCHGCCFPYGSDWLIMTPSGGAGTFTDDPWEVLGQILGDIADFIWIDTDYGWRPIP